METIEKLEETIQLLREENYKLELQNALNKPLYSRRKLQAEHDRMREALDFYAKAQRSELHEDAGNKARETLVLIK